MSDFTIYDNPRCTRSRAALALLQGRGIESRVIEYPETPPSATELKPIIGQLGIKAEQLVRNGEDIYKTKYAGKTLSDAQWIETLVQDPVLIERPSRFRP